MKQLLALLTVVALLALVACGAKEEATPAPPAPAPEAKPAWQQEWERLLAAAKREGKLVMLGPAGPEVRRALTEPFEKRYGITVEYLGERGAELVPRLTAERDAGQHLWDVRVGATSYATITFKPRGYLDPLEPALILPEVKDPKSWQGGQLPWLDKERMLFVMARYTTEALGYNTKLVDPKEFKSYKDLLDSKWKGKILLYNPTVAGAGDAKLAFFYVHKELGPDFIRALAQQEVIAMSNIEQMMEWLAAGRYPIALGTSKVGGAQYVRAGLIASLPASQMKEGGSVHVGTGALMLFNRAPHPNAAKLFINWLLTKEGATEFAKSGPYASTRLDVPKFVEDWELPQPGYLMLDDEEGIRMRGTVRELAKGLFTLR